MVADHQHVLRHADSQRVERHHHAERDRIVGADHGFRLYERPVEQPHGAIETALHGTFAELVPVFVGGKPVSAHMRVECGEQFRRFERQLVAGHVCGGRDALLGQMFDDRLHRGVFVDAYHGHARRGLPSADLHDRQRVRVLVQRSGKVSAGCGHHDQPVHMAVGQRFDAFRLRFLRGSDAQQQLLRFGVDGRLDLVEQLRGERFRGARNDQTDGFRHVAAQRARCIVD